VLRIVAAAFEQDRCFGTLIRVLAESGGRASQAARLTCADLQAEGVEPRLLMPTSRKGKQREKKRTHTPVQITAELAAVLKEMRGNRPDDAPLLVKADGSRWLEKNKSEQWGPFRLVVQRVGLDADIYTTYCLRHSSICRGLLRGLPTALVARLHDTSAREIEAHYGRYIADITDGLARRALLQPEPLAGGKVVALPTRA
jgi:integrase